MYAAFTPCVTARVVIVALDIASISFGNPSVLSLSTTKEPRAKQQELTRINAFKTVFTEYFDSHKEYKNLNYDELSFDDVDLTTVENLKKELKKAGYPESKVIINEAVRANIDESSVGYAITVTSKGGYGGDIKFTVGFLLDGTVSGISCFPLCAQRTCRIAGISGSHWRGGI